MSLVRPNSCRLCAGSCEGSIPIFENTGSLAKKIKSYLHVEIKILKNAGEGPKMCSVCYKKIITWDRYVEQVQKVQDMFSLLTGTKTEESEVEKYDFRGLNINEKANLISYENKLQEFLLDESIAMKADAGNKGETTREASGKTDSDFSEEDDVPLASQFEFFGNGFTNTFEQETRTKIRQKIKVKFKSLKKERPKEPDKNSEKHSCSLSSETERNEKSVTVEVDDESKNNLGDGAKENKTSFKHRNSPEACDSLSLFVWECLECQAPAKNWNALTKHCKTVHGSTGAVKCACGKVLQSRASIAKHRAKHTVGYGYKCQFENCNKTFHRQHLLDIHSLSHLPKEMQPWMCCKCSRRFHTESLLKQHEKVHLPKEEKLIHPCEVCQKKFCSKSAVSSHIRAVHFGERPFVCDQCGHSFTSKGILHEHLTIHSDVYNFHCKDCNKSFKTKYRLKIHMDTHVETKYQCPVCSLSLNTRRTLRMHLLVHRDEKAFQCTTCGKAFKRSKDLKNHYNLHTGRRPYTCPFCQRTFANGSNCRSHKRRMHPEELKLYEATVAEDRRGAFRAENRTPGPNRARSEPKHQHYDSDESKSDFSDFQYDNLRPPDGEFTENPVAPDSAILQGSPGGVKREEGAERRKEPKTPKGEKGNLLEVPNFYPSSPATMPAFPGNPFFRQ